VQACVAEGISSVDSMASVPEVQEECISNHLQGQHPAPIRTEIFFTRGPASTPHLPGAPPTLVPNAARKKPLGSVSVASLSTMQFAMGERSNTPQSKSSARGAIRPWLVIAARASEENTKRLNAMGKQPPHRREERKRRKLALYSKKQAPLEKTWELHNPWRAARYKLSDEGIRLFTHSKAFSMYYQVRDKKVRRACKKYRKRLHRVHLLYKRFEYTIEVVLVRLGWAKNISQAREWVKRGRILINDKVERKISYTLQKGDKLTVQNKIEVATLIKSRYNQVHWRMQSRAIQPLRKGRGDEGRKYNDFKRKLPWARYLRYFLYHNPEFICNYNTLTAIYRPINTTERAHGVRYPRHFGPGLFFWREVYNFYRS